jgi:adenosylhomocysteine nucleosidase
VRTLFGGRSMAANRRGTLRPMTLQAQFADSAYAQDMLGDDEDIIHAAKAPRARHKRTVIAFVGMAFEAKIAAGPGVLVLTRHSRRELSAAAKQAARLGYRGIISFGVAGGLAANLQPGNWVVASSIVESEATRSTDAVWSGKLCDAIKGARLAPIMGVDAPVAEPETKRALHRTTGAAAVDMESHVVARVAAEHGLAFTALRVIVDPVDRAIPPAALVGMGPGVRADAAAVLREVIARPAQLSSLLRVSLDAYLARTEMLRVRELLGPHFGLAESSRPEAAQSTFAVPDLAVGDLAVSDLAVEDLAASGVAAYRSPA